MKENFQKTSGELKKENCTLVITWKPLKKIKYSVHREKNSILT